MTCSLHTVTGGWPRYSIITPTSLHQVRLDSAGCATKESSKELDFPGSRKASMGRGGQKSKFLSQPNFSFISFIGILLFQEEDKDGEISLKDYKEGQVQQLDMEEVGNEIRKFPIKLFLLLLRLGRQVVVSRLMEHGTSL